MKRPGTIYLLVGFYGVLWMIGLVTELFNIIGLDKIFSFQPPRPQDQWAWGCALPVLTITIIGIWFGKSWGRALSFLICSGVILFMFYALLPILTLKVKDLFPLVKLSAPFNLMVLLIFTGVFYLTLRPEVGQFCQRPPFRTT